MGTTQRATRKLSLTPFFRALTSIQTLRIAPESARRVLLQQFAPSPPSLQYLREQALQRLSARRGHSDWQRELASAE